LDSPVIADPASAYAMTDGATFDAWTPRLALHFHNAAGRLLYVSATRGFKSGGFNPTTRVRGGAFRPEFAWSYEGGVKQTFGGGRAQANLAVFATDYRDLQVLTFVATGFQDTRNAAAATIRGAEAEVTAGWGGVELAGSGSWLHATYDRYVAIAPGNLIADVSGNRLSYAPLFSGHLAMTYTVPRTLATPLFIRGDMSWQTRVFFSPFNDAVETQPAYALLHLRAGVAARSGQWNLTFSVRNVLNQRYFTGTLNQSDLPAILARPGVPRQWGTQLTLRR
jgi:iron complex outermembrane recepter protein